MTNYIAWDNKVYLDYLLCYGNNNSTVNIISYFGQLSFMLGNGIVKVLRDLQFYLI